jgi:hypothetical protein
LGERLVRNEEVSGSIPLSSTKFFPRNIKKTPPVSAEAIFLDARFSPSVCAHRPSQSSTTPFERRNRPRKLLLCPENLTFQPFSAVRLIFKVFIFNHL